MTSPRLTAEQEAYVLSQASDYALSAGLVLRPPATASSAPSTTTGIHAPYSLFPTPYPRRLFEQAKDIQPLYNALYAHVAVDDQFLEQVVGGAVSKVDEFQGRLYDIWKKVKEEGIRQPLHLGLFRSDYLIHAPPSSSEPPSIKQVEFNTISSSFGALATKVGEMHRALAAGGTYPPLEGLSAENLPQNGALKGLAAGMAEAHAAYGNPAAKVLFVVQANERNAFDQRFLEWELLQTHKIQVLRLTFPELATYASLSSSFALNVKRPTSYSDAPEEISVVYYRSAYTPNDYPSSTEWDTRLLVERSLAIKCPTVALQLAGSKKVQQVLADPAVLAAFLNRGQGPARLDKAEADRLTESFTSLYPLDDSPEGLAALKAAYATPERFVLKPQREGGGNNVYRADIPPFLDALEKADVEGKPKGREGYILMDLIVPPEGQVSTMVKAGEEKGVASDVVSELGIYGSALFRESTSEKGAAELVLNETIGHLLRTKGRESDEGGVAVGFSVIDSPLLVEKP